jgi:small subunit ribosomal protein S21
MIKIIVKPNENMNRVLSRFKSACMNEGILQDVRAKSHFVKPCLKRKLKREAAAKQRTKDELKIIRKIQNEEKEWRQR